MSDIFLQKKSPTTFVIFIKIAKPNFSDSHCKATRFVAKVKRISGFEENNKISKEQKLKI